MIKRIRKIKISPLHVVLPYFLLSVVWVVFSDHVLKLMCRDTEMLSKLQTFKGITFVAVTSLLLYFLTRRAFYEIKRNSDEKASRERFYRKLIEQNNDIIVLSDGHGKLTYFTRNLISLLGYTEEELQQTNFFQLVHHQDIAMLTLISEKVRDNPGKVYNAEFRVYDKEKDVLWVEATMVNHLADPAIAAIVTNARDITERRKTDEHITNSELLFRSIFEQAVVGMSILDSAGKRILVNEIFCSLAGYSEAEVKELPWGEIVHPDDRENIFLKGYSLHRRELENFNIECRLLRRDGSTLWVEADMHLITDAAGEIKYYVQILRDISDKKKAQMQLAANNSDLETLIYRSSHDLRGPIVTLIGLADVAMHEVKEKNSLEYFSHVREVSVKMDKILSNLSSLAIIKKNGINGSNVFINDIITSSVNRVTLNVFSGNALINIDISELLRFRTDGALLSVIMTSLVDNALTFRKNNVEKHEVQVSARIYAGLLIIIVTDNGVGIDDKDKDKIFEFFYRGHNEKRGSGLGLFLVRAAVERLQGRVNIVSHMGKGTTVTVELPEIA